MKLISLMIYSLGNKVNIIKGKDLDEIEGYILNLIKN